MIEPLPIRAENSEAVGYVSTEPKEGLAQLEVLKSLGCKPHHRVLEIGCGALIAGYPIMQYLDAGNYEGVDPNVWLVMSTLKLTEVGLAVAQKRPHFTFRADFRSDTTEKKFDFIISHSILSHASNEQLTAFFVAAADQLAPGGRLAASIRLAEGNEHGSPGSEQHGADFTEWQYPGVSWFRADDVLKRAHASGLDAVVDAESTRTIMRGNPKAIHDWILATRVPCELRLVTGFFRLSDRNVDEDEQFRQFDRLAACGLPITLFLDSRIHDRSAPKKHPNVAVIPINLEDWWPFREAGEFTLELPRDRTPEKDTRDFLLLQNSKIEMLATVRSIALESRDPATHFAWIDFGIMKIVSDEKSFLDQLARLAPPPSCVLAPGCWPQERADGQDPIDTVNWRFCGGFLLVDSESIHDLHAAHRKELSKLFNLGRLTWEVNVWANMEHAGQRFDWYEADHNDSIIDFKSRPGPTFSQGNDHRVCLVMIVKNESKIIRRCLESALPFIDSWHITDTGSTDDTRRIIRHFFEEHPLPGVLEDGSFKNFAQARNDSLKSARHMGGWEYALLIDADMVVEGELDKAALIAPAYKIGQYDGSLEYFNTRLLRRDVRAEYVGVTHEFLSVDGVDRLDRFEIHDRNDGGSKGDKAERDIRLLGEGLVSEPNNERYMFYLANTLRDVGRFKDAIIWYRKRIERGGWDEEVWYSYYRIACAFKDLNEEAEFIRACFEAYNFRPQRGEPLKLLAQYYRERSKNDAACAVAELLAQTPQPNDELFVEHGVYDYGAKEELSIAGFYSKLPRRREASYRACADLTIHQAGWLQDLSRRNFGFHVKSAATLFGATTREIDWKPDDGWAPMNPSVFIGGDRLVLVRTVNYKIADGQYPTIDGSNIIKTKNYIVEFDGDWRAVKSTLIEDATEIGHSAFPVEGFEDCRLWADPAGYFISATVRNFATNPNGNCEIAIGRLDRNWRIVHAEAVRDYEGDKTQKNWMPILDRPYRFLYLCDPTIVIDCSLSTREVARHTAPACLVNLRGGSQLVPFDGGWLCLTHEVMWRPERVYFHRFVRFDPDFKIIAISDPFYFERIGIEFCAGLARDGNRLVASFGVHDTSAHLAFFDTESVARALHAFG